jgi:hypothetical protein
MIKEDNKKFALKECVCRNCPSFLDCQENIGYCVFGKSKCIEKRNGCICGGCPVHKKLGLKGYYFCFEK